MYAGRMEPTELPDPEHLACSVANTLDVVGDRWSLLVIRDAFYGLRRFDEFQADLGVARNVLSGRLKRLVEFGILAKVPYEDRPPRFEYHLTQKGLDLLPVILTMMAWGDRHEEDPSLEPVHLEHKPCGGHGVHAVACCSACGEELRLEDVRTDPIPVRGARRQPDLLTGADA